MKYKVGDKVRIRSQEWIDAQPKSEDGGIELETNDIVPRMFEYAGKTATITKINEVLCNYKLDIDDGHWSWTDEMFEGKVEERTEKPTSSAETLTLRDFFAGCALAGLLASGNRYTMAEEPGKATADAYYLADLMLKVRR